jgi:hypothetical protein
MTQMFTYCITLRDLLASEFVQQKDKKEGKKTSQVGVKKISRAGGGINWFAKFSQ